MVVVNYDPRWPARFEEERERIVGAIGGVVVAIEHIGSTSVLGLPADPTVDILAGIRRLDDARDCIEPLARIDFEYVPEYEAKIPDRRYFRKGPALRRTFHLHMVEFGGSFWDRHLFFRDYLRTHPEDAKRYGTLKRTLAERFGTDREGYTDAKTEFILSVLAKASDGRIKGP